MIGIYNSGYACTGKLFFSYVVICSRNCYKRHLYLKLMETSAEFQYFICFFFLAVYHYSVCPCCDICLSSGKRIIYPFFEYEAFNARYNHEVCCDKRLLSHGNLCREPFDSILVLLYICTEQGVLLQPYFVFYNDSRNTVSFKCPNCERKVLNEASGITVDDNWFCRNIQYLIDCLQTGCEINVFNIRLALCSGICKA